jgi:hypothetical protein
MGVTAKFHEKSNPSRSIDTGDDGFGIRFGGCTKKPSVASSR